MSNLTVFTAYLHARFLELRDRRNDEGATAVEYGLLVAGIAVVIIVAVGLFGTRLDAIFRALVSKFAIPT
jgi:pilus assembly protein Flp/PilA